MEVLWVVLEYAGRNLDYRFVLILIFFLYKIV